MPEPNHERALVTLIREICAERGIAVAGFSDDWLFCLQKDGRNAYLFGYDFSLNSAVAKMICKDKSATSDLLGFHGIPRIEHRLFHGPQLAGYVPELGTWSAMLDYLASNPGGVVCKPNEGTGGNSVFLATTPSELEKAVYQIFSRARSLCLCPFEEIEFEYRVALLGREIQFIYRKVRPTLLGDGRQTARQLLLASLQRGPDFAKQVAGCKNLAEMKLDWARIPAAGEAVKINWRHNLGQGAQPELLTPEEPEWATAAALAIRAAEALEVKLASVDLAATPTGLKVLEINSGIMMESLVRLHPDGRNMARRFYDRIICQALGLDAET